MCKNYTVAEQSKSIMSIIIDSVKPSKSFEIKLTIPQYGLQKCDSECHNEESQWKCKHVKILPIGIQSDGFDIIGDLFLRRKSNDIIRSCLVVYNVRANCSILQCNFIYSMVKSKKTRKDCIRFLPKSENNKNVASEEQFKILDFELESTSHYQSRQSNLILRGEILLDVKFDIDTVPESKNDLNNQVSKSQNSLNSLVSSLSAQAIDQFNEDKNFKIISNGEDFYFNKTLLSLVSEVFQKMLQGNSKEAQDNCVEISDFSQDTIRTFEKFSFSSEKIKPEEITVELLMFANKYFMKPLETKCKNYFVSILNKNNLLDFIKAAYDIDDEEMLKVGANYFSKYKNELKENEEFKKFNKSYPLCMNKILGIIVFNEMK